MNVGLERIPHHSPYRRPQQQQQQRFVTSGDAVDTDDDEDFADVTLYSVDDQLSRDRPKRQIPAISPSRCRADELRGIRRPETGNDVIVTTAQRRQRSAQAVRPPDTLRSPGADGHDTGLGSISLDDNCSDAEADNNTNLRRPALSSSYTAEHEPGMDDRCQRLGVGLVDGEMQRQIEARFRETMASIAGEVQQQQQQQRIQRPAQDNFDMESVQTDDIENEFRKTLIDLEIIPPASLPPPKLMTPSPQRKMVLNTSSRQRHDSSVGSIDTDDASSVRTEDFETHYHRTGGGGSTVKQVAHTPVPTFDPFMVDSDLETVKSQLVHDTFQTVLARNDQVNGLRTTRPSSGFQRRASALRRKREASPSSDLDADLDDIHVKVTEPPSRALMNDIERWKKSVRHQPATMERPVPLAARQLSGTVLPGKAPPSRLAAARQAIENKTDYEVSCRLRQELTKLQSQLRQALSTKQAVQQTNDRLQTLVSQHQLDIMAAEKQLRDSRATADTARSELVMTDLKRDAARRELESLTAEVDNRRLQLQRIAVNEKNAAADEQLSVSDVRSNVDASEERRQMEKSLSELQQQKERLDSEKADFRQHTEHLQKELDRKESELVEIAHDKEQLREKVIDLETSVGKLEQERHTFLQHKSEEFEASRSEMYNQLAQSRERFTREVAELRNTVDELTNQLAASRQENRHMDDLNLQLREQLEKQACELEQQNLLQNNLLEENIRSLRAVIKEKEAAVNAAHESAQEEKRAAVEDLRRGLNADHQRTLQELEQHLTSQLAALQAQLSGKELEMQVLRNREREQEEWMGQMTERMQQENYDKMQAALESERIQVLAEKDAQLTAQLESMKEEMVISGRQLREELQRERDMVQTGRVHIDALEQELEKVQQSCRNFYRETLQDDFDDRFQEPLSGDKLHYQEMLETTTAKLNDVVHKQREELDRLRQQNSELNIHSQERSAAVERSDRRLLEELRAQCEKIARVLQEEIPVGGGGGNASMHSLVNQSRNSSVGSAAARSRSPSKGQRLSEPRSSLTHVATNLVNWCEKLQDRLVEQQRQIEEHNAIVSRINSSTKEDIETVRRRFQEEKYQALETLKNRLIKEHLEEVEKLHKSLGKGKGLHGALREKDRELQEIQQNMKAWKDQTLEKLAQKFKEEMNRELARRNSKQLSDLEKANSSQLTGASQHSTSLHRPPNHQSSPVRTPHNISSASAGSLPATAEKLAASVPDLTAITSGPISPHKLKLFMRSAGAERSTTQLQVRQLELQAQRAESNWKHADDRARNNEHLLNQKMIELAKLHSLVTQQTKELAHLQRAYSKLQTKAAAAGITASSSRH